MVAYPGALGKPAVAPRPEIEPSPTGLSRLSARMRFLIERGSVGAGGPYPSRSEADFAMAAAMFAKGYSPEEVASLPTDPLWASPGRPSRRAPTRPTTWAAQSFRPLATRVRRPGAAVRRPQTP
jgi:hypothetical protein